MKNFKSYIIMATLAVVTLFSACSDDGYWNEYVEPAATDEASNGSRFSFTQSKSTNSLDASEKEVVVTITRTNTANAVTLPVKASTSSAKLQSPSSVTFEAGQAQAQYTISFDDLDIGETYTDTLSIDSAVLTSIGIAKCVVSIKLNYTWVSLGMGGFTDNYLIGGPYEVEILQAEGFPIYRVMHPYNEGLTVDNGFDAAKIGTPADYIEFEVDEDGYVFYDPIVTGYLYNGETMCEACHPYEFSSLNAPEYWIHNVQISEGVFQLAPYYYMSDLGDGWNRTQNDGMIMIYLPGYVPAE